MRENGIFYIRRKKGDNTELEEYVGVGQMDMRQIERWIFRFF